MIALGGPKLKPFCPTVAARGLTVSMIALGGPKLKRIWTNAFACLFYRFNEGAGVG